MRSLSCKTQCSELQEKICRLWMKESESHSVLSDSLQTPIVHGYLQVRILEWVAFPFSGDLPNPRIKPRSPTLQAYSLLPEPPGKTVHACVLSCFNRVQLCMTLWTSPPGSSVHGILQARILQWVAVLSSRGSS